MALTQDSAGRLLKSKVDVVVQRGAGERAGFPDAAYAALGVRIADDAASTAAAARAVLKVQPPTDDEVALLDASTVLVSLMRPGQHEAIAKRLAERQVSSLALELVPRITRAQSMDVLSSQSPSPDTRRCCSARPSSGSSCRCDDGCRHHPAGAGLHHRRRRVGSPGLLRRRGGSAVWCRRSTFAGDPRADLSLGATFVAAEAMSVTAETDAGYARSQTDEELQRPSRRSRCHIKGRGPRHHDRQRSGTEIPRLISAKTVQTMRPAP